MDGVEHAGYLTEDLLPLAGKTDQQDVEELCIHSLCILGKTQFVEKYLASKKGLKRDTEKTFFDFIPVTSEIYTVEQQKNKNFRFGLENNINGSKSSIIIMRPSTLFRQTSSSAVTSTRDYEDVVNKEILLAPICDICIVQRGDVIPDDFYRISKTMSNKKANLNAQSGGNHIFLCIRKDLTGTLTPVTSLVVVFPDKNEFVPPGYLAVKCGNHACNLNVGTSLDRIYLCYKKDKAGNPLTDVQVIMPGTKNEEVCPKSFNLIETSPTGIPANVNTGTIGHKIFLCYKQHLNRLSCLKNDDVSFSTETSPRGSVRIKLPQHKKPLNNYTELQSSDEPLSPHSVLDSDSTFPSVPHLGSASTKLSLNRSLTGDFIPPTTAPVVLNSHNSSYKNDCDISQLVQTHLTQFQDEYRRGMDSDKVESVETLADHPDDTDEYVVIDNRNASSETKDLAEISDDPFDEYDGDDLGSECFSNHDSEPNRCYQVVVTPYGLLVPAVKRECLHPLLAALYVRHGEIAMISLQGLCSLLKDTDFFESDLKGVPISVGYLTMLDVTIDAVCDRFDNCLEVETESILAFLKIVVKHSVGRFSSLSLQRTFRSLAFLCNYYSTRRYWFVNGHSMPYSDLGDELPCYKVLKEMIWSIVAQVESADVAYCLPDTCKDDNVYTNQSESNSVARCVAVELIEDVIDSVEVSRLSEMALIAIVRQSNSSRSFWVQIIALSKKLFSNSPHRSAFVSLCSLCKLAGHTVRITDFSATPRDLGSKLLALEALTELCKVSGEKMCNSKIIGYQIRRLVVPCILINVPMAMYEYRLFTKTLRLISVLWKNWRVHIRIEFANICEKFIIPILQTSTLKIRPIYQMIVLQEVATWFDQPHLILEMFVNFDMDGKFVSHWNVFSHLVQAMCDIARKAALVTGAWDWKPNNQPTTNLEVNAPKQTVTVRDVHMQAIEEVARIAKTLMDATGHAFLSIHDSKFRSSVRISSSSNPSLTPQSRSPARCSPQKYIVGSSKAYDFSESIIALESEANRDDSGDDRAFNIKYRKAIHQEAEELIKQAIIIYQNKSLKRAIEFLISKDFMADSPQEIANFLRVYKSNFDPSAIGDFLGEGGTTPFEEKYWSSIRFRYTRAVCFVEMELVPALRLYLTGCGFRLPGEAQKIDRFVDVFQKIYWQDNCYTSYCPLKSADTVHMVTYATIMLNTDLHRANIDDKKKKRKKMTKVEFINNLRGIDHGTNIDRDYLTRIYDSIAEQPIVFVIEAAECSSPVNKEHMTAKAGTPAATTEHAHEADEKQFTMDISRNIRDSEDLLRSLSCFTYPFQLTSIDTHISMDLVSFMFETVWFHFHAITEALLADLSFDLYITMPAMDILCYAITSAILLNKKTERHAFALQLERFQKICKNANKSSNELNNIDWFAKLQDFTPNRGIEAITEMQHLFILLKDSIQQSTNYEITRSIAAKIDKRLKILSENTFFVREGELSKRSRSGRLKQYRFFLFSDYLYYCHQTMNGEYRVHEELSLTDLNVAEVDEPTNCSLYLTHPTKSFVIIADSIQSKLQWYKDLQQTIESSLKRQDSVMKTRRLSMVDRISLQKSQQEKEAHKKRFFSTNYLFTRGSNSSGSKQVVILSPGSDASVNCTDPTEDSNHNLHINKKVTSNSLYVVIEDSFPTSTPNACTPSPTGEERAKAMKDAQINFPEKLARLDSESLSSLYAAGVNFWRGMTESRSSTVGEGTYMRMNGLQRIVKFGPYSDDKAPSTLGSCPNTLETDSGPTQKMKKSIAAGGKYAPSNEDLVEAWKGFGNITENEAKMAFLITLLSIAPYWKYDRFLKSGQEV